MVSSFKRYSEEAETMNKYQKLLDYYNECFKLVDCFHFNSEISASIFKKNIPFAKGKVVSISHKGIQDNREKKDFFHKVLHIGFIGNSTPYKGLPLLLSLLQSLECPDSWDLKIWGGAVGAHHFLPVEYKGKFNTLTVSKVYEAMDVLIVPSIWKETFSLVTLEALSYGVPVIVSNNVGAQDIVKQYDSRFIYHSEEELKKLLLEILKDRSLLQTYNNRILELPWKHNMEEHVKEIVEYIYKT